MNTPTTRTFTPARIVALGLIALAIFGLGYLRFAPDTEPVSVPFGAQAGDLVLESCDYSTENGSYAAECGTLVVPENRADPDSRLIALPITRIKALSETPAEPIFRLQGGPGITNMEFSEASRFADDHDVVLVGYRGVDGSERLDCPEVESAMKHSIDLLGEKSLRASADAFRSCADRLQDDGVDLAGYTLPQRVDDLEAARVALGYERINLVSESVGTRTAMIYSWRHPRSINRSVMIGVNPPGNFLWDAKTTDEQIGRFADVCSNDDACSKRTDDLEATLATTDIPERWFFLPIRSGNVRVASFYGLMETTQENAPLAAPMTLSSWLSAAEGDPSGFWLQSLLAGAFFPGSFVWGEYAATATLDAQAAERYFSSEEGPSNLGRAATTFGWGGGLLSDAWPTSPDEPEYSRVRTSSVDTLLVSGELDITTPPVATMELLPYLPNGNEVVLPGFAHSLDFWTYQPEASTRLLNTFYETGRVDDSLYEPQRVDFTPEVTQPALAKGIAGTMVGLAFLTAFSLLWMAVRVSVRGGYGRKAGAVLRSLWAAVLGLGGWFAGVLLVITTMPGVPLDDELLAAVSVGIPVGLGVYLAWVNRDRPAETKAIGFAAALAGGLLGAWLGFHATVDLLALLTAIAGSVAGANLTLILLDIARERPSGNRLVPEPAVNAAAPETEPATRVGAGVR